MELIMDEDIEIVDPPSNCTSDVWKFRGFEKLKSGMVERENSVCRLYKTRTKYTSQTTNMRNHLNRKHNDLNLQCTKK